MGGGLLSMAGCSHTSVLTMALSDGVPLFYFPGTRGAPLVDRPGELMMVLRAGRVVKNVGGMGRQCGGGGGFSTFATFGDISTPSFDKAAAGRKGLKYAGSRRSEVEGGACRHALEKRLHSLQFGSNRSIFRRKDEIREDESQHNVNLGAYHGLRWEAIGEHIDTGHDGQTLLASCISSQFFKLSLICSLCLGSPWFAPVPALASVDASDANRQALVWERNLSNLASLSFDFKDFKGDETVLESNSLRLNPENLLSVDEQSRIPQPGNSQPGALFSLAEGSKACEESYGFLPCSDSLGGNVSLIVAYGYFLLLAAQLISKGSELLLEVMNPGLLGGLLLPILGALPDALLVLVSGAGGTVQEAQEQVMVGIGVLAGSIVMLLTIGWAGSLYAGRCDLSGPGGTAVDRTLTQPLNWAGTGVTTDEQTRVGAWIMVLSALPFVVVQIPLLDGHPAEGPEAAVVGAIVCLIGILSYSFYQVSYPWLQGKRIEEARLQFMRSRALQRVTAFTDKRAGWSPKLLQVDVLIDEVHQKHGPWRRHLKKQYSQLSSNESNVRKIEAPKHESGQSILARTCVKIISPENVLSFNENKFGPSRELLKELFIAFDSNKDGKIQREELKGLLVGLELEEEGSIPDNTQIDLWLQEFDVDLDGTLSEHEFMTGIGNWAQKISKEKWSRKIQQLESNVHSADDPSFWAAQSLEAKKVLELLETEAGGEEDEEKEGELVDAGTIKKRAALYLAGGAALAALFADPLVDSIGGFSNASGIPPFFVAFVVTPFASNASELFSSFIFAKGRRKKNISLTFSQLYGGVTMNNTLCLGLFLAVVYIRHLTWDFSSEVTVILLSVLAMGAIGGARTTFPLFYTLPVLAIYPLCISLVAILDNYLGWH